MARWVSGVDPDGDLDDAADVRRRFSMADAPPEWCDVHHLVHWAHGGPTSCDNGALLCEGHHTSCHERGFTIRRDPGTSRWHTYRPDGTEILTRAGP